MSEHQGSREKLIQVAVDLFASRGFAGTSIRDIANMMGMSISNIYHYFGNKEGLLLAILEHTSNTLLERLREAFENDQAPLQRLKTLVQAHLKLSREFQKESRIFFLDEERLSQEGHQINRKIQREILEMYVEVLNDLQSAGLVHTRSIKILAFNILGVINWHLKWFRTEGELSHEEAVEEILAFILYGALGSGRWE